MKVFINGDETAIEAPCSVKELLARCHMDTAPCAVEVNERLVPKRSHGEHIVHDGDRIEIVTLVGGG